MAWKALNQLATILEYRALIMARTVFRFNQTQETGLREVVQDFYKGFDDSSLRLFDSFRRREAKAERTLMAIERRLKLPSMVIFR